LTGSSEGLDGGEEVSAVLRARSVHPQLAEATILENRAEGLAGLAKDGVAVGDEEQRVHPPLPPLAGVVQGGDHRLAGSGGGDHEVTHPSLRSGEREILEHPPLVVVGVNVEESQEASVVVGGPSGPSERTAQSCPILLGADVGLEAGVGILPVAA